MRILAALSAAIAVYVLVAMSRRMAIGDRVAAYLEPPASIERLPSAPNTAFTAGITWSPAELRTRRLLAVAAGVFAGLLMAQGDLFLEGPGRSSPALAVLGAVAGGLGFRLWLKTRRERRAATLRSELPVVADMLSLHLLAGESVARAIESFAAAAHGVAASEFGAISRRYRGGEDLSSLLSELTAVTADPAAARLYRLLAESHLTGGPIVDGLQQLAADYRAGLTRELTSEGGKRSVATYAPILALMVPVTLLFLMYPTLLGLRQIAGSP